MSLPIDNGAEPFKGCVVNVSLALPTEANAESWGMSIAQAKRVQALFLRNEIKRAFKRANLNRLGL